MSLQGYFDTITFTGAIGNTSYLNVYVSNFNFPTSTGASWRYTTINTVNSGTINLNSASRIIAGLTINPGVSNTTTMSGGSLQVMNRADGQNWSNSVITLTSGTLNLNGYDMTTGKVSSSGTTARSIAFGSNNIILFDDSNSGLLSIDDATNFTWTGTGGFNGTNYYGPSTINFGNTAGGSATNAPNFTVAGMNLSPAGVTFGTNSWFKNLTFSGGASNAVVTGTVNVDTLTIGAVGTAGSTFQSFIPLFTRTQTWTMQNSRTLGGIGVNGAGVTLTLGSQTYSASAQLIMRAGTINFNATTFTIGGTFSYFGGTITNNTTITVGTLSLDGVALTLSTGTFTVTSSLSIVNGGTLNISGATLSSVPTITLTTGGTLNASTVSCTTFNFTTGFLASSSTITATTFNYNGGTLPATCTINATNFVVVGSFTLPTSGLVINGGITLTSGAFNYNGGSSAITSFTQTSGTVNLNSNLTFSVATGTYTLTAGTLTLNNNNLSVGAFSSNNSNTRSIQFGSGNIVIGTTTAAATVVDLATATNFTFTGTGGFVSDASVTRTYNIGSTAGGSTTIAVNLSITSGSSTQTIGTGS
jgi:hypothetical protein